jgi:hypothetical protein
LDGLLTRTNSTNLDFIPQFGISKKINLYKLVKTEQKLEILYSPTLVALVFNVKIVLQEPTQATLDLVVVHHVLRVLIAWKSLRVVHLALKVILVSLVLRHAFMQIHLVRKMMFFIATRLV